MMDLNNSIQTDFKHYKDYVKNRKHLFEREEFSSMSDIYYELYTFSEAISKYENLDKKSKINFFVIECKNALIISFDLLNLNYLNSSKQILRSSIESFFRFSLALSRHIEYKSNSARGNYASTESLKKLNSLYSSHKVFNLTKGTLEYFEMSAVEKCFVELNTHYSKLSSNVHVTGTKEFSPQKYLEEYSKLDVEDTAETCELFKNVLNNFLLVLIYFDTLLNSPTLSKKRLQFLEFQLDQNGREILNKLDEHAEKHLPL